MSAEQIDNLVAGKQVPVDGAELLDVLDPASGELLARVPLSGAAEVDAAVRAAAEAFPGWAEEPLPKRARRMFALQQLFEAELDDLARIVVRENGKHLDEARGEIRRGIEVIELAASMTTLMKGESLEQVADGVDVAMNRYPLGVVAAITPFNFPAMIPLWFVPLAIAAGNTVVLKPSQRTPLSAARIAELFAEAGFPPGVLNVVHGAQQTVEALIDHEEVRAVSFVGSAPVAKAVYERSALRGKRVQALAGAKNHLVVMPDAALETAVPAVFASAFSNAGQRCLAGSVAVGVGDAAEPLVEGLAEMAREASLGAGDAAGSDADSTVTPVTTEQARERITQYIEVGEQEGARLVVDGRGTGDGDGFFLGPTIFDQVTPQMRLAREEIFGPVLAHEAVASLDEAIEAINASQFGNAAAIFTRDGATARRFCRRVQCGMIGVNVSVPAPVAYFPFAGWRGSFFGDLHATGRDGVEFFTERKVVTTRWPD